MKFNTSSSIMQFLLVFGLLFTYLPVTQADHRANLAEFVYPAIGEPGWFLPLLDCTRSRILRARDDPVTQNGPTSGSGWENHCDEADRMRHAFLGTLELVKSALIHLHDNRDGVNYSRYFQRTPVSINMIGKSLPPFSRPRIPTGRSPARNYLKQ
jgi:hypothetical protein